MPTIFVNYRTDDGDWAATHIDGALSDRFGSHQVFLAPKSIPPGADFERTILSAVRSSTVLLVVIGPRWLTATDPTGQRKLDDPTDWVRREIAEALQLGITVVPVLIDQAERLTDAHLPSDIMKITTAQFLRLDHRTVHPDMDHLATALTGLAPQLAARPADPPLPPAATGPWPDQPWQGGTEIRIGDSSYLLHDGITEVTPADRSWVARQAVAERLEPHWETVLLRQVGVLRRTPAARQRREALLAEAALLTEGHIGWPRVSETVRDSEYVTLVLSRPKSRTLREVYGPTDLPLDHFHVADFLTALSGLCDALGELHWQKLGHRNLNPDVVLVSGDHVSLRDLGLATVDPEPGEGVAPYQAPEQRRAARGDGHAGQIDVYQVAAIAYHVLTGHPPAGPSFPPLSATDPRLPPRLDKVLARALDPNPGNRPKTAAHLEVLLDSVLNDLRNGGRK